MTWLRRPVRAVGRVVQSPVTKWVFLGLTLVLAAYVVWSSWEGLTQAAHLLTWWVIAGAVLLTAGYNLSMMLAWRAIVADLGSPLSVRSGISVFSVSQLGKYVPGGVWNIVAAGELGAGHDVPRRRSVAAMATAVLVSLVSGTFIGAVALPFAPLGDLGAWRWLLLVAPLLAIMLLPPVLTRIIALAFKLARREPLEQPLSWRGLGKAVLWAMSGWLLIGSQVWVLATGLGLEVTAATFALAAGGFALAWVVGFLVVFVPAGAGAREAVLVAVLGSVLANASVVLVALISRVLMTCVDLAAAGLGGWLARKR